MLLRNKFNLYFNNTRRSNEITISQCVSWLLSLSAHAKDPNVLAIMVDDVAQVSLSAYSHGMTYNTPNIDRIANEGALFTDHYAQPSCTAGRAAFLMGQLPVRTGLTRQSFGH